MCNQHTEDRNKDEWTCNRYWKYVANVSCLLFAVLMLIIGSLTLVFAAIYQSFESDAFLKIAGTGFVIGLAIACLVLGCFVWRAVASQGREDPGSYRENALEIIKLFSALLAIVTALSALLLMFFS